MNEFDIAEAMQPFATAIRAFLQKNNAIAVPEGFIESLVEDPKGAHDRGEISLPLLGAIVGVMSVTPEEAHKKITRHLLSQFNIKQGVGETISTSEKHDWKVRELLLAESYYWERLRSYWEQANKLPYHVITSVDQVTDEVLELLGDPDVPGPWLFRGLVMGNVQSGKTTNYSALIAKAFDVGYGHIIVLAGLTNSLREQTQKRMDETLVGTDSRLAGNIQAQQWYEITNHNPDGILKMPASRTSILFDFKKQSTQQGQELEDTFLEPTLFVIKKNPSVLTNLRTYLSGLAPDGKLKKPLLVIDDEADNASVNTKKNQSEATRINNEIRELIALADRRSYVGYTATPFANIFIDPNFDTEEALLADDLFPKHFIKALDAPENYIGAHNLFGDQNEHLKKVCVVPIETLEESKPNDRINHESIIPAAGHKKEHPLLEIPWALEEAILSYILFCGIQELSDRRYKHSSMLINISRFNLVQQKTQQLTEQFWREILQTINADIMKDSWETNPVLQRLHQSWVRNSFSELANISFDQLRHILWASTQAIDIEIVNMQGGSLEYPEEKKGERGKRIIAIGGLALSRGLTLEGLAVSYVVRNIGAQDTLLQTARWFGYRDGYEDLCRIYLTRQLVTQFTEANDTIEELRNELTIMKLAGKTPNDFGLKVRHSDSGLAITARQKMWSSEPILYSADYELKQVQIHQLYNDASTFNANESKVIDFLAKALDSATTKPSRDRPISEASHAILFTATCINEVIDLLDNFASPLPNMQANAERKQHCMVADYIRDRRDELSEWEIIIPYRRDSSSITLADSIFSSNPALEPITSLLSLDNARARTRSNLVLDSSNRRLSFDNRSVADAPKSDLVHGFPAEFVSENIATLVPTRKGGDKSTMAAQILSMKNRPILMIHAIAPKVSEREDLDRVRELKDIALGDSQLVTTLTLGFPSTHVKSVVRKYQANIRLQEILRQEAIEETDDNDDED